MSEARPAPLRRIVLPLDAAAEAGPAIGTAIRLAARIGARVHAVFVEDEDLLNVAALPFTRQAALGAARPEALTSGHVELHLRLAAESARRELAAAAERHQVACSFEVFRGAADIALAAASDADIVVGGLTRPVGRHFRLECRWWSAIEGARAPLLLARRKSDLGGAVAVLLRSRAEGSKRLLAAAAQIAAAFDCGLTVFGPPSVAGADLVGWIADAVRGEQADPQIEIGPTDPALLRHRLCACDCRILAVDAGLAEDEDDRLRELAEELGCDLLVVR